MRYRPLGKTGLSVSEIGLGTWGMGSMWGPRDDAAALAAILESIRLGINFIDTAYVYGNGHSEALIAQALSSLDPSHRDKMVIATKVPPKNYRWPASDAISVDEVFPGQWIIEMTEKSLRNLTCESVDLQQLHVWSPRFLEEGDWRDAVAGLKRAGKIRFFGISVNDHLPDTALGLVESGLIDSVQVIYNIFDQSPEDCLLPLCGDKGVGVIARVPFDEGSLTGTLTPETQFPKSDWRRLYFTADRLKETCVRVTAIRDDFPLATRPLTQLALQFCLSHPAVSTVIPGMRKPAHVRENVAVMEMPELSSPERDRLRTHRWVRNFYPTK